MLNPRKQLKEIYRPNESPSKGDKGLFDFCYKAKGDRGVKLMAERGISVEHEVKKQFVVLEPQKTATVLAEKKEDL